MRPILAAAGFQAGLCALKSASGFAIFQIWRDEMMKEVPISRVVHRSEQFRAASEEQSLASEKLKQSSGNVVGKLSAGRFTAKEFQVFLDQDLAGLLGAVAEFMDKTNALRSAWEDGLILFTDAIESQAKDNEKLRKQIDLLRIEKGLKSLETENGS